MKKALLTSAALVLLGAPLFAQTETNPGKGGPSPVTETALGCSAIPDDAYDGSIGSMTCLTVAGPDVIIEDVTLGITANHTWVGDLIIKVVSPAGTITTVMNRPGFDDVGDDGTGGFGFPPDLAQGFPLSFNDAFTVTAEDLGINLVDADVVCQTDSICDYSPNPGRGPGTGLGDFIGENALGDWMVCMGDAGGQDTGDICTATLDIAGAPESNPIIEVPTLNYVGLAALLAALGLAGAVFLRRRA